MKTSSVEKLTRQSAAKAASKIKPTNLAVVFFEQLQLPGTHASEAGPAAVLMPAMTNLAAAEESMRIATGLPTTSTLGGRPLLRGKIIRINKNATDEDVEPDAFNGLIPEMVKANITSIASDRAYDALASLYVTKNKGIGAVLRSTVRGYNSSGEKLFEGSVLIIERLGEWDLKDTSDANIGQMLAAIYGRGGVYRASGQEAVAKSQITINRKAKNPKASSGATDEDDDLAGEEWKRSQ